VIDRLLHIADIVVVRQHDALGVGRGTRGIGDIGQTVGLHSRYPLLHPLPVGLEEGIAQRQHTAEVYLALLSLHIRIEQDIAFHGGKLFLYRPQLHDLLVGCQHHHSVGVVDAEGDILLSFQLHRQRHADCPGMQDAQLAQHPVVFPF